MAASTVSTSVQCPPSASRLRRRGALVLLGSALAAALFTGCGEDAEESSILRLEGLPVPGKALVGDTVRLLPEGGSVKGAKAVRITCDTEQSDSLEMIWSPDSGRLETVLPGFEGNRCRMELRGEGRIRKSAPFRLSNIVVLQPEGGIFRQGDSLRIEWRASSNISSVMPYLFLGRPDANPIELFEGASIGPGDAKWQGYQWAIPDTVFCEKCRVLIEDYLIALLRDSSSTFSIRK